jgi:hypothetical protein
LAYERICRGDGVGLSAYVDAQEFSQQDLLILAVPIPVTRAAAVPHAEVEVSVRSEDQVPAVMVGIPRVGDPQDQGTAGRIGQIRIGLEPEYRAVTELPPASV